MANKKQKQNTNKNSKAAALGKRRAKERMRKKFVAVSFSRADLELWGYDTSKVNDAAMNSFVQALSDVVDIHMDLTLPAACEHAEIPERPENPAA
jgi:hypothetical protein